MSWHLYNHFIGTRRGKNALKLTYLQKALSFVISEQELLKLKIRHPEQFRQSNQIIFKSILSIIPKFQNLGIMGMAEILTSLSLLGGIEDNAGQNPSTIALADTFEYAFGFSFNDIYDCQSELFKRKPYNLTKTLDALKAALTKEYKRRKSLSANNKDGKKMNL